MLRILAVTNIYPTPDRPAAGIFVEQQIVGLRRIGLDVDLLAINRSEEGMRSYLTVGAKLQKYLKSFQPDVIHVMYGGVLAEEVTRILKSRPTVVSFCGSDLLGERLSGPLRNVLSQCGVFASHVAARRAVGIVVKSRNLKEALPTTVDRSKVRIIPSGIDLERFRPIDQIDCCNKLGWDPNKFHVLFTTSSDNPCKRLDLAQAAVETSNRLGLNAEMHILRGVPHEEVPLWFNASNVVLLTSSHEGSPNVIKEALACNVPIVSVAVGDVLERINGVDGCYIALPDPHDLGGKLVSVKSRGGQIAGRERVLHLSLEQTALKLMRFYHECMESCQKSGIKCAY